MFTFIRLLQIWYRFGSMAIVALADPRNARRVSDFVKYHLLHRDLPRTLTLDGREFELISVVPPGKSNATGKEMLERAKTFSICTTEKVCHFFMADRDKIPYAFRYNAVFVFPCREGEQVRRAFYDGVNWCLDWYWLGHPFQQHYYFIRLRSSTT